MDALKSILIFCNDDKHPDVAVTTSLQIEHYDHAPMVVTTKPELYQPARLVLTDPGDWDLRCLYRTKDLWLDLVVVLRGDVVFKHETIALILAHTSVPTSYFYFTNDELVAFTTRSMYLKLAMDNVFEDDVDINDWGKLVSAMKLLTGKVNKVEIEVGGVND